MPLNENQPRCHALTKTGKPCASPAIKGQQYCRMHIDLVESGVRISGRTGRLKLWREGDLALKLEDKQEHDLFEFTLDSLNRDFDLNESSDRMQAEMAAFYFVKWRGAAKADEKDQQVLYDDLMRKNLSCLKATREKREGIEIKVTSPAEWAAQLLADVASSDDSTCNDLQVLKADSEESEKKVAEVTE